MCVCVIHASVFALGTDMYACVYKFVWRPEMVSDVCLLYSSLLYIEAGYFVELRVLLFQLDTLMCSSQPFPSISLDYRL